MKTFTYKMVVLGHYSVGKSSIVLNFVKGEFNPREESTIGASFLTKTIFQNRCAVKYEIWDTAGQERYYSLIPMYYRGAQVALIVYDITSQESFESAKRWVEELKYDKPQEFLKVLVANKMDLRESAMLDPEVGRAYAENEGLMFYETSAKTGHNIQKMFSDIAEALPKDIRKTVDGVRLRKPRKNTFCC
ncbi:small GTP-binding protein domain protein [Vittaforma corneae ATCC 50505]|uniref:Small GTP-binding protein domain protein n=1 Tax=Vittaforma corneae (strain ATCC 50505) TaxID=993615 RepID=L2GQE9_VITCO|nr:small GTP-binding protein domain protein [Vittaforma corneae ATCC 50505]ELA42849.1 small GTP-binding protein domain protein [Vittaforma corneae ATCC 50505]